MKKLLVTIFLMAVAVWGYSVVIEQGSIRGFLYGTDPACAYDNWLSHVVEGLANPGMNYYAPWDKQTPGFGNYRLPVDLEMAQWRLVTDAFSQGNMPLAESLIEQNGFPYQVVLFRDIPSGREYFMLRELLNNDIDENYSPLAWDDEEGSFDYGWGLYIFSPGATNPVIVNVAHPCDDFPSTIMALDAFEKWNARYLMIAGAGREVAWQGTYYSNNSQSFSDPSRRDDHPFNYAYKSFQNEIRQSLGRLEFSIQIHSYDWNSAPGQSNVQLSRGNQRTRPQLPIRDQSRSKRDLINLAPYIIFEEGELGQNAQVPVNHYYSAYVGSSTPVYYTRDGYNIQIPNNPDYPGAQSNVQMLLTDPDTSYDVLSPFLHVEMDELPKCFPQEEEQLKWFYGWDTVLGDWVPAERWTRFRHYYSRWIDDLATIMDDLIRMDDYQLPGNPERLTTSYSSYTEYLSWDRAYAFDFDSYEIHLRKVNPNGVVQTAIVDRDSIPELASQITYRIAFEDINQLPGGLKQYRVRARDKAGNYSEFSNPVLANWPDEYISNFTAAVVSNSIKLSWQQSDAGAVPSIGYRVYRSLDGVYFVLHDDWISSPALMPQTVSQIEYYDSQIVPNQRYYYRLHRIFSDGVEHVHWRLVNAMSSLMLSLVASSSSGHSYTWEFSRQYGATDSFDNNLDQYVSNPSSNALCLVSLLSNPSVHLRRDVRNFFDPTIENKLYNLKLFKSISGVSVAITMTSPANWLGGNLYIRIENTPYWHDLKQSPFSLPANIGTSLNLQLCWGYLPPELVIESSEELFIVQGEPLHFAWSCSQPELVDYYDLYISKAGIDTSIASSLTAEEQSYTCENTSFIAPGTGYRLKVVARKDSSQDTVVYSDYPINILPPTITQHFDKGWHLISIPTGSVYTTVYDTFGELSRMYFLDPQGLWVQTEELLGNTAYLLYTNQAVDLVLPNQPLGQPVSYLLAPGYNLLPNPHQISYDLSNLRLVRAEEILSWEDLRLQGLVDAKVYSMDRGVFSPSQSIEPSDAVIINYYGNENLRLVFDPREGQSELTSPQIVWQSSLCLFDDYGSSSGIVFGSSPEGSYGVDPLLDLAALPKVPGSALELKVLQGNEAEELGSGFLGVYPDYNTHTKYWDLVIGHSSVNPVKLRFDRGSMPAAYQVKLRLETGLITLRDNEVINLPIGTAERIFVGLEVTANPNPLSEEDLVAQPVLRAYPNPFVDELRIELSTARQGEYYLDIFNLRGQLVKRVFGGYREQGRAVYTWDGRDQASAVCAAGVYILRYSGPDRVFSKKIILLR